MAQLKDLLVNGASRLIGDAYVNKIQITAISAPTSAGGTTYGLGTNGYILKSDGSSIYWGSNSDTLVKQTAKTDNVNYKLLATPSASPTSGNAAEAVYDANITVNPSTHTITATNFAGNASTATTASKLSNTSKIGDTNKPVYFTASGIPSAISYTIDKSVPSNAVFTDTTYTAGNGLRLSDTSFINTRIPFVAGTQTASTGSWTGVCNDITALYDGLTIAYWLPYAGSGNASLNLTINGVATGAKNCYYSGATRLTTHFAAGNIIYLTYQSAANVNGTNYEGWWSQANYDSNTVDRLRDSYFRPYAGQAIYRYKFLLQGADNRMYPIVTTNQENATQVAKTPTTTALRPGRIWYYNTTTTVSAGGLLGAQTIDSAFATTIAVYNFNADIPTYCMVYLRGTYDKATDLFTLYNDGSSPCTSYYTTVPTNTANITLSSYFTSGYYYMLLGGSYSSANYISLFADNPLYYFDGTNLIPVSTRILNDTLANWTGSTNITTLGTISTGTWNGTTIDVSKGGTGATSASAARTNLGLGTMATQSADSYLPLTGGKTLTGGIVFDYNTNYGSTGYTAPIVMQRTSTESDKMGVNLAVKNLVSGIHINFGIGSNGKNHGVYSYGYYDGTDYTADGAWLIYRNSAGRVIITHRPYVYTGTGNPNANTGENGDLYIKYSNS